MTIPGMSSGEEVDRLCQELELQVWLEVMKDRLKQWRMHQELQ